MYRGHVKAQYQASHPSFHIPGAWLDEQTDPLPEASDHSPHYLSLGSTGHA